MKKIYKNIALLLILTITNVTVSMNVEVCDDSGIFRQQDIASPSSNSGRSEQQKCIICLEDVAKNQVHKFSCGHSCCKSCCIKIIDFAIQARSDVRLRCPELACLAPISPTDLAGMSFAGNRIQQLQRILTEKQIDIENGAKRGFFSRFDFVDIKTSLRIFLSTKACPSCRSQIEKDEGCLHMKCTNCDHHFCWDCGNPWAGHRNYYRCGSTISKRGLVVGGAVAGAIGLVTLNRAAKDRKISIYQVLSKTGQSAKMHIDKTLLKVEQQVKNSINTLAIAAQKAKCSFDSAVNVTKSKILSKKNVAQAGIACSTYLLLNTLGVNYSQDAHELAYKVLGYQKYHDNILHSNFPSLKPIGLQFENGRIINAGLSIATSFAARPFLSN